MTPIRDDRAAQFRKGALELAILALLEHDELYGVEIVDRLGAYPGIEASGGTVYPLLGRLSKSGAVMTTWRESPVGPPRKYYRLSDGGRRELLAMAAAWRDLSSGIETLLGEVSASA